MMIVDIDIGLGRLTSVKRDAVLLFGRLIGAERNGHSSYRHERLARRSGEDFLCAQVSKMVNLDAVLGFYRFADNLDGILAVMPEVNQLPGRLRLIFILDDPDLAGIEYYRGHNLFDGRAGHLLVLVFV